MFTDNQLLEFLALYSQRMKCTSEPLNSATWKSTHFSKLLPFAPEDLEHRLGSDVWDQIDLYDSRNQDTVSIGTAAAAARILGIKNKRDWTTFASKMDCALPLAPDPTGHPDWSGWGDFLDTLSKSEFIEFFSLYSFRRELSGEEPISELNWRESISPIQDAFPTRPTARFGHDIWHKVATASKLHQSLEYIVSDRPVVSYGTCSAIVAALSIDTLRGWFEFAPKHLSTNNYPLPGDPSKRYIREWKGWGVFLGTKRESTWDVGRKFVSYQEARTLVQTLKIKTIKDFNTYMASDIANPHIPKRPDSFYAGCGWTAWVDFLSPKFLSYTEAKRAVQVLKLNSEAEFRLLARENRRPDGVPCNPYSYYKDEFEGWPTFLGKTSRTKKKA